MLTTKVKLLGAVAVAACAFSSAQAVTYPAATAFGGGGSLAAPYIRQAANCYANPFNLFSSALNTGTIGASLSDSKPPVVISVATFNYVSTTVPANNQNCGTSQVQPTYEITYSSTGSGRGIRAIYSHSPTFFGDVGTDGTPATFPAVSFATSETSLGTNEVTYYNTGGGTLTNVQGVTVAPTGTAPTGSQYANPKDNFGAVVQVPLLVAPVAITFDPVYKKVRSANGAVTAYSVNLKTPVKAVVPNPDGSVAATPAVTVGGLKLDQAAYCAIFGAPIDGLGPITNLNDSRLTTLNGGQPLRAVADLTNEDGTTTYANTTAANSAWTAGTNGIKLQIVGRGDSSGTTSLWTRHLAVACASSGNYADSTSTLPSALRGATYPGGDNSIVADVSGKYTLASGSDQVAKYLDFTVDPSATVGDRKTQFRIGYIGPDFALPGVGATLNSNYGLWTAALATTKVASGVTSTVFVMPNAKSALAAFGALLPPQSTTAGAYSVGTTANGLRANPQDWVKPASKFEADGVTQNKLAFPVIAAGTAYPIVGTSNLLAYTCYASDNQRLPLTGLLSFYLNKPIVTDSTKGLLAISGLSPLPAAWRTAVTQTFVTTIAATAALKLNVTTVGATGVAGNTNCNGLPGA